MNLLNPFTAITFVSGLSIICAGLILLKTPLFKAKRNLELRHYAKAYGLRSSAICGGLLMLSALPGSYLNLPEWQLVAIGAAWILACMIVVSMLTERFMKNELKRGRLG